MESFERKEREVDASAIQMMSKIRSKYLRENKDDTNICLLLEEKIIYTTIAYLYEDHPDKDEDHLGNAKE